MRRYFGALLVLHGLAHAGAGMWASTLAPTWIVSPLWWLATVGFVLAGLGLLGAPRFEVHWRPIAVAAALASLGLLAVERSLVSVAGMLVDAVVLLDSIPPVRQRMTRLLGMPLHPQRRPLPRSGTIVFAVLLAYVAAVVALRGWFTRWGSTAAERALVLPGDSLVPDARYRIDHAVTIHAAADSVWPWLAQIGQDRGGFYSYTWLERAVGDPVTNAERIVPEWQHIAPGDLVRSVPRGYLFGLLGDSTGWRVAEVAPGRALVLEGWGAFVLRPIDDSTTRFIVRTRGPGTPSFVGVPLAPLGLLVFEPAHFIMQRGMMLGIKERAERGRDRRTGVALRAP